MIRIGDFSKLSRVSIKTLRFYDEMGLLKPVEVDRFTGYRYYEYSQLRRLYRILALKDLGFSLEEIGHFLCDGLNQEQMRGMLKLRQAEIRQSVLEETQRLERVGVLLGQIEQEDRMSSYDVVIKKVAPVKIASIRGVVPTPPEQGAMWQELGGYLSKKGVQSVASCFTLYHDDEFKESDWDLEVCMPIDAKVEGSSHIKVYSLPEVKTMACTIHHGPFKTIGEAYNAIMKWIEVNGYRIVGPCREVYLRSAESVDGEGPIAVSQSDPNTVTEIQYPVEKV